MSRLPTSVVRDLRPGVSLYGVVLGILASVALVGCGNGTIDDAIDSVLPQREATYKSSRSLPPLEVPPDLSSSTLNDTLKVPAGRQAGSTTLSEYNNASQQVASVGNSSVLREAANVRVARSGDKRWLVIDAPPAEVWPRIRDFWLEQGFLIQVEDASIGIMETDWAEKRAAIKGGFVQGLVDKLSNAFYGVATRDKYRTRLEHGDSSGQTEVFLSHRGAEEVIQENAANLPSGDSSRSWQPRPSDPELEAEMLARMMVFFGNVEEASRRQIASAPARPERASMQRDGGGSVLTLEETFSRAWRRTGLALDRVGFTVEDRDRSRGLYFVRYVDPERDVAEKEKEGFFSQFAFWRGEETRDTSGDAYLISLLGGRDGASRTQVVVLDKEGERDATNTADRILALLHEQLK